jgi:precorrin-6B methylase 2
MSSKEIRQLLFDHARPGDVRELTDVGGAFTAFAGEAAACGESESIVAITAGEV